MLTEEKGRGRECQPLGRRRTLPEVQMCPDVLIVWLYLYMVALVFGDGPLDVLSE